MKIKLALAAVIFLALVLRLYHLGSNPPSLYWDEASLGYNAFSIAQTGHDEHGEFLPLGRFIAFGDYKAPGYIYTDALAIKLLGLSEFSTRLPSALAGVALVLATYFLTRELFWGILSPHRQKIVGLVAAFAVAISPWQLQFSRGAFEANLATAFSAWGVLLLHRGLRRHSLPDYLWAAVVFAASMYTFNSHRISVPLIIVSLLWFLRREVIKYWRGVALFAVLLLFLNFAQLPFVFSKEGRLRFQEVTWLNDLAPISLSNDRISQDGGSILAKALHNRRLVYGIEFLRHLSDHFRPDFLFLSGDVNPRLSIQTVGELYWWDLPFLLVGIYYLVQKKEKIGSFLFAWVVLGIIPAATARETPHALRILPILPVPQLVIALGLFQVISRFKVTTHRRVFSLGAVLILSFLVFVYLHNYHSHYPKDYSGSWQYGYKQMVQYVSSVSSGYDNISVTETYGRPYIYFLYYRTYSPIRFWQTVDRHRDWYGFWYVSGFDKYLFGDRIGPGRVLYVRGPGGTPATAALLRVITDPGGSEVFEISESR